MMVSNRALKKALKYQNPDRKYPGRMNMIETGLAGG
jgi:hypothetical protein